MPIAANVPVSLDGTMVFPGDYIYGNSSGVVITPSGHLEQVLKAAIEIDAKDKAFLPIIRHEDLQEVRKRGSREP